MAEVGRRPDAVSERREGYEGTLTFVGGEMDGTTADFYDAVPERNHPIQTVFGRYEFREGDDWKVYAV